MRKHGLVRLFAGLAALAGLSCASSALAQVTEFTSQSAFDAAIPNSATYRFNAGGAITPISNSTTFNGVTFADDTTATDIANSEVPLLFMIDSGDVPTYGADFLSFQNQDTNIEATITLTGANFFGFNYGSYVPIDGNATLTLNTGQSYTITPISSENFIGFSSTTPITSITIDYPNSYAFDVISYSTVSAAPEPATWMMMLIGVGIVGAALRWRARQDRDQIQAQALA